ncbi:acriflavin resistance protein [Halioglobus sp. HI00S01]|uniref:efflux RND transporter permease subunit n=1 Tax=Halioglobus sp. HI00S01 TaxID=1822214 RepID=UPI0007C37671|nr:efflux RND transporter permease subunit [Halioglobus sp. HI00S01]KZX58935.1 acriflavin resistance protein [Halioglobus sp. HI00S01]
MVAIISWFAHRPLLVNLIMGLVFVLGFLTIADMRYEYNPKVDMGILNITTIKAGAGAEEVELTLTLPLEEELLEVDGVKKMTSRSMENVSLITLTLDLEDAERHQIMRDIQRAVDRAETRLPQDLLEKPQLEEVSTLLTPIMEVHITGDVPEVTLREVARNVAESMRVVEGIASVKKIGYRRPEVRIQLLLEKLAALGISHDEIIVAIQARNQRQSGGAVDSFLVEKNVVVVGQFDNPVDVRDTLLRAGSPGNAVYLRDVATIVEDFEDWEVQTRVDGRMSIALQALKKARSDEVHTAAAMRAHIDSLTLPPGVEAVMVADVSRLTMNVLQVLTGNAILGLIMVFGLLHYFLHIRFAIWAAIGLPFAVCLSFLLLSAIDVTINVMTLTAIILMLGILVDDAVVVSENTKRLRQAGLAPLDAAVNGAGQMAQPVIFSALTTMLAFAPLLFIGSANGEFLKPFPMAVIVLLLASLFESLCILPGHLAHIPAHIKPVERSGFNRLRELYQRLIDVCLKRRAITLAVFLSAFSAIVAVGAMTIPFSLYPDLDIDTIYVKVELPTGSRFEETVAVVQTLEEDLRAQVDPIDLRNITSVIGHHNTDFYGAVEGMNEAWALIAIQLQPLGQRSSGTSTHVLVEQLQARISPRANGFTAQVEAQTDLPVTGKPVEVDVISNADYRYDVAAEIEQWLAEHPAVSSQWNSYLPGKDTIDMDINHALLASRGLTVTQVSQAIAVAMDGLLIDELQTLDERVRYRLNMAPGTANQLETLQRLVIINGRGEPVFLNAVANFVVRPGDASIKHHFGRRTTTVFGIVDTRKAGVAQVNAELKRWMADQAWGEQYPDLRIVQGGEQLDMEESLTDLGQAALICLITIFAALVILFNSLSQPLLIFLCIPFGLTGVVLCYSVQGLSMGMMAITGIIGLMGVLVNDSLIMMHSLNRRRGELQRYLTIHEVADVATARFRPVFITSVTTAVGLFPTAYGIMGDNSYIRPMVMSMAWGVVFGGLVSLVLLPTIYTVEQDLRQRLGGGSKTH